MKENIWTLETKALTSNGDESAVADVDDVVTTDGLCVFGVGVGDQRTNATPGRQDIPSPHWEPKTPETLTFSDSWSVSDWQDYNRLRHCIYAVSC